MFRLPLLLPLVVSLGGCIIYDTRDGKCRNCGWDDDTGDWWADTDTDTDADTDTDTDADAEVTLHLDPSAAEVGTTFIGSLTADPGFDLATIADLQFYGDVQLLASEPRDSEILLSLTIPADAAPGTADLLAVLVDGSAVFVEDALTLLPAGSGTDDGSDGSDGSSGSDGSDGSSGDGSTDSGDGSCP